MPISQVSRFILPIILNPVLTTQVQVQGSPGHPVKYRSMADCFRVMLAEEGLRSFYRGTVSSFMKVVTAGGRSDQACTRTE